MNWIVADDWPDEVPITEAEIEVFEARFGDCSMSRSRPPLTLEDQAHDRAPACRPLPPGLERTAGRQRSLPRPTFAGGVVGQFGPLPPVVAI
jgi:hypothetical protein